MPLNDGAWHLQLVKRLSHADPSRDDGTYNAPAITSILPMAQAVYTGDEEGKVVSLKSPSIFFAQCELD